MSDDKKKSRFDSLWDQFWLWIDMAVQLTVPARKSLKKKNGMFRRRSH